MNINFCKAIASFRSYKNLFSAIHIGTFATMVRFFPNPYDDYKPGSDVAIDKDAIIAQINDYVGNIVKRLQPIRKNVEGGLYVGTPGVSFMFLYLSKNPSLSTLKGLYLQKSFEYIKPAIESLSGDKTSFLLGDAGIFAISTVLNKELGSDQFGESLRMYKSLYPSYLNPKFLKCGGDELFVGRAGYLAGALWISRELNTPIFTLEELYKICEMIVASGREYAIKNKSPIPLMYHYYNTEYLGSAHGISFILQILLSIPGYLTYNKAASQDIQASIEFLASLQTEEGNWPSCMEEIELNDHKLVHWCHGAPGIVYLMAKAYITYKDQRYLDACTKASDFIWRKGLLHKGPGICHGVAGNGYVFLLLHRLTGDSKYLYRAKMFAEFLTDDEFIRDARLPDNPESLYEGTAGTVCFLSDLLVPDKAEFPFQDVFSTYCYK